MSDILLIHGSCHGAWAWDLLIPELGALGHNARAIDLPGSGDDATPLAEVLLGSSTSFCLHDLASPATAKAFPRFRESRPDV